MTVTKGRLSRGSCVLYEISSDQRQIVILRDYLDLPYAEIAGVLGVASGTVMSRLHRARLGLKSGRARHIGVENV